jgi:predicted Zn-ribbon and HTH transcriptional regulator
VNYAADLPVMDFVSLDSATSMLSHHGAVDDVMRRLRLQLMLAIRPSRCFQCGAHGADQQVGPKITNSIRPSTAKIRKYPRVPSTLVDEVSNPRFEAAKNLADSFVGP